MQDAEQSKGGKVRDETPLERLDRNLEELTGELRVIVTGVQVLFAFLLIVPFNTGFAHIGRFEQTVYVVTLILAALAAVCTIAPSPLHRLLFRYDDKHYVVFISNRIVIAGLAFLALAMCGALLLVTTKLVRCCSRGAHGKSRGPAVRDSLVCDSAKTTANARRSSAMRRAAQRVSVRDASATSRFTPKPRSADPLDHARRPLRLDMSSEGTHETAR